MMSNATRLHNKVILEDPSQQNVYGIAISEDSIYQLGDFKSGINNAAKSVLGDSEITNLLIWLASQQGISPELALKKAVVTAAYIYDVTTSQGGRLLVQRKDDTIGEIVLK